MSSLKITIKYDETSTMPLEVSSKTKIKDLKKTLSSKLDIPLVDIALVIKDPDEYLRDEYKILDPFLTLKRKNSH